MRVGIIDYGMGNIGSIRNMLKYVGADFIVSSDAAEVAECDKLILPGVGHFDLAMRNLADLNLVEPLRELVLETRKPILGICLGMQLMCSGSEEGGKRGLGFFDADVRRFTPPPGSGLKVPHMGWSTVEFAAGTQLAEGLHHENRFYFVHSYCVNCNDPADVLGSTRYGQTFVSAIARDNIAGVQFHPEKSHKFGMRMFRNFVESPVQ